MNITLPNGCKVEGEINEVLLCMRKVMGKEAPKKSAAKSKKAKGQKIKLNYLGLQAEGYVDEILKIIEAVETQNLINRTVKICYAGTHYMCVTCGHYHNGPHYHEWVWCMSCSQYVTGPHGSHTAPFYPYTYTWNNGIYGTYVNTAGTTNNVGNVVTGTNTAGTTN